MASDSPFKWLTMIVTGFCLAAFPSLAATTLTRMEANLARKGGHYVIDRYFNRPDAYEGARLVETGQPASIALAVKLIPYSDAGSADELHADLAEALARKPEVVLPYVNSGPHLTAQEICLPFLSEDEPRPKLRAMVERTRRSLLRVRDGRLQQEKTACLQEVETARANLR